MYNIDEFKEITSKILTIVNSNNLDVATISEELNKLNTDYEITCSEYAKISDDNKQLAENNEKLRRVNTDLFLQVGTNKKQEEPEPLTAAGGEESEENSEPLPFTDLFGENGELK